jgi:hypothetical protein
MIALAAALALALPAPKPVAISHVSVVNVESGRIQKDVTVLLYPPDAPRLVFGVRS